jgi:cytochrome c-type biogenesis protein CcmH/NrfG
VSPLTLLGAVGLTAIAAVAVLWPYQRGSAAALQRLADPLEDERRRALRRLRDLDEDRAAGKLDEPGYRTARAEAEAGAVAVLRALEAREGSGELAAGLREVRRPAPAAAGPPGGPRRRRWPRRAGATLAGLAAVAAVVALLAGAVGDRGTGQMITGQAAPGAAPPGPGAAPLERLERQAREHPGDVAAHLALAEGYLDADRLREATLEYLGVLRLQPGNLEAKTRLGLLLFRAGLPEPGLRSVEQALATDPRYPEALYAKGVILFMGMGRPKAAVPSLRSYLRVAPFGAHRDLVTQLLKLAAGTPGAKPPPDPSP